MNVSLVATTELSEAVSARRFRECLMAGAVGNDGLDHVFARRKPESLEVVLFMLGDTAEVAEVKAVTLCERVIAETVGTDVCICECRTRAAGHW